MKQRKIINILYNWEKSYIISKSPLRNQALAPFNLHPSGEGSFARSHLTNTVFHSVSKLFSYHGGNLDKSKVLVLAPTGVVAVNINDSGFNNACSGKLSDKNSAQLKNKYSE